MASQQQGKENLLQQQQQPQIPPIQTQSPQSQPLQQSPGKIQQQQASQQSTQPVYFMDIMVVHGELGLSYTYHKIPSDKKISHLQNLIQNDTKIEIASQYLIAKSGFKVQSEDILGDIERQNALSQTQRPFDTSKYKSYHVLYVFNDKLLMEASVEQFPPFLLQEQATSIGLFNRINQESKKQIKLDQKIAELDFQGPLELNEQEQKSVTELNGVILEYESRLFKYYSSIKRKIWECLQKEAKIERGCREIEEQSASMDTLLMRAINEYQICKNYKTDISAKMKSVQEHSIKSLQKYEEALQKGKQIELPEAMKKDGRKYLLDVYYGVAQMEQWKIICLHKNEKLKTKFGGELESINQLKQQIKEQKTYITAQGIQTSYETIKKVEEASKEIRENMIISFTRIYEDYKNARRAVQMALEGSSDKAILEFVQNNLERVSDRLRDQENVEKATSVSIDSQTGLFNQVWEQKLKNYSKMQREQQKLSIIVKSLGKILYENLKILDSDFSQIEKEFSDFMKPYNFITNFKQFLKEICRRNEFNVLFERSIKMANNLVKIENEKRKVFLMAYGKQLPKDFIPEINSFAKSIGFIQLEVYPKIDKVEGDRDDSYAEFFKQFENGQEAALKQEEKIGELKREIAKLKEGNGKNLIGNTNSTSSSPASNQNANSSVSTLEVQNSELRQQIIKLKNDIELLQSKKSENVNCILEIETKKNIVLQNRVNSLEAQIKETQGGVQVVKLQRELEELERAYQNVHNFYRKDQVENDINSNAVQVAAAQQDEAKTIVKLNQRIFNLTQLLQQTAKVSFNSFMRKQGEKQQKIQEKVSLVEQKNIQLQEELVKQKNKMTAYLEEKLRVTDTKYSAENKKIIQQLESQKESHRDEISRIQANQKQIENELSEKTKQLRNAQESISRITAQTASRQKDSDEQLKKLQLNESKIKSECARQVSELQVQLQKETEKAKKRIQTQEIDLANKQSQLDKALREQNSIKRDFELQNEEFEKIKFDCETGKNERDRLKRDSANLKNKIENLELSVDKKSNEIIVLNKNLQQINGEKMLVTEELNKEKTQIQDMQKRLNTLTENAKQIEVEKQKLSDDLDKSRFEFEKKSIEQQNLQKQLKEYNQNKTKQMEMMQETQMNEKIRIQELNEQVSKYRIEQNVSQTKLQIQEADLTAREQQINLLKDNLLRKEKDLEEAEQVIRKQQSDIEKVAYELDSKQNELNNLQEAYEQALIEVEIQQKNAETARLKVKENEEENNHEIERLQGEIAELNRNIETYKEREKKTNKQNIEVNGQLTELRAKLEQKQKELTQMNEEIFSSKNHVNLKEMSLKQLSDDVKEKEESLSAMQLKIERTQQQMEEQQKGLQELQQEVELQNRQMQILKKRLEESERVKSELEDVLVGIEKEKIDLQKIMSSLENEKDQLSENVQMMREQLDQLESEKQSQFEELKDVNAQLEKVKNESINIEVHSAALMKLEENLEKKEIQISQITKEQGQLAQELINAESSLKTLTKESLTNEKLAQKRLQTISELQSKLNVDKRDQETQWTEEVDEKNLTLSTYEAQKFKKILQGIDNNKRIPIISQKNYEHIDITQALRRTAFIQEAINYTRLEEGTKMLFIPSGEGVYIPLVLKQLNEGAYLEQYYSQNSGDISLSISTYKNNYFLDFDTLDKKYIELLKECSLLLIASIKNIIPKQVNFEQNQFSLREGESYYLLQVEQPEFVLGLEDEDHSIKNYV